MYKHQPNPHYRLPNLQDLEGLSAKEKTFAANMASAAVGDRLWLLDFAVPDFIPQDMVGPVLLHVLLLTSLSILGAIMQMHEKRPLPRAMGFFVCSFVLF